MGFSISSNGSIISINNFAALVEINKCSFLNSQVTGYGGVIYIYYSGNVTIDLCKFIGNFAGFGGAIYYNDDFDDNSQYIILKNNAFQQNSASQAGGALMFYKKLPINFDSGTQNNTFLDNKAFAYGDNYASEPYRIFFLGTNPFQETFEIQALKESPLLTLNAQSGIQMAPLLKFVIVDIFYQTVTTSISM